MKNPENNRPFIVDSHIHIGDMAHFFQPDNSLPRMLLMMDRLYIKWGLISHINGLMTHDFKRANEETIDVVKKYEDKLKAYLVFDPQFPAESLKQVEEYIDDDAVVGVKIHPAGHKYPLNGSHYFPLYELVQRKRKVVLTHTWDATPQNTFPYELVPAQVNAQPILLKEVNNKFPDLHIIMAHSGGHYHGHLQALEMLKTSENIFTDIAGETVTAGLIEWFVKEVGSKRILFGSDMNWLDPRVHIGRVLGSQMSEEDKENIFFRNALDLFRLGEN